MPSGGSPGVCAETGPQAKSTAVAHTITERVIGLNRIAFIFRGPKCSCVPRKSVSHIGGREPRVSDVHSHLGMTTAR
jgi:hypothetical protein